METHTHAQLSTVLVASDIHGNHESVHRLLELAGTFNADMIILAGDTCPASSVALVHDIWYSEIPILMVRGNSESPYEFQESGLPIPPVYRTEMLGDRRIVVTHGDRFPTPLGLPVEMHENDIFISGHTHCPSLHHEDGKPWMLNPGSTTYPRNRVGATFAVIDATGISIRSFDTTKPIVGLQAYWA